MGGKLICREILARYGILRIFANLYVNGMITRLQRVPKDSTYLPESKFQIITACVFQKVPCVRRTRTRTHASTHAHTQARTHAHTLCLLHTHIYHTHTAWTFVLSLSACTKLAENSEIGIESLSQALNSQLPPVPTLHRHPPSPPHTHIHTLARLPVFSSPRQQHMSACAPLLPPPSLRIL